MGAEGDGRWAGLAPRSTETFTSHDVSGVMVSPSVQTQTVENQTYDERLEINDSEEVASISTPTLRQRGKRGMKRKERKKKRILRGVPIL